VQAHPHPGGLRDQLNPELNKPDSNSGWTQQRGLAIRTQAAATALAGEVLAADSANAEAEDLLAAPSDPGEIRRLTIFFADLVDSTLLSTRVEPETYRLLVGRYREQVLRAVNRYEGHIGSTKGDGVLAVFGYPVAHEDDVRRAVHAGPEITQEVALLSDQARRRFGIEINVRVGVHRELVYLDTAQDDVYGLAANLAARVSGVAPPGAVVVSDAVEALIRNNFELEARPAALVKGVEEGITHYRVVAERAPAPKLRALARAAQSTPAASYPGDGVAVRFRLAGARGPGRRARRLPAGSRPELTGLRLDGPTPAPLLRCRLVVELVVLTTDIEQPRIRTSQYRCAAGVKCFWNQRVTALRRSSRATSKPRAEKSMTPSCIATSRSWCFMTRPTALRGSDSTYST
jgi:class 3 adenylate cyclase